MFIVKKPYIKNGVIHYQDEETFRQMFLKIADKILDKPCTGKNAFSFTKIKIQFFLPCMTLTNCYFLIQHKKRLFHDCRLFIALNNLYLLSKILINVKSIIYLVEEIPKNVQK